MNQLFGDPNDQENDEQLENYTEDLEEELQGEYAEDLEEELQSEYAEDLGEELQGEYAEDLGEELQSEYSEDFGEELQSEYAEDLGEEYVEDEAIMEAISEDFAEEFADLEQADSEEENFEDDLDFIENFETEDVAEEVEEEYQEEEIQQPEEEQKPKYDVEELKKEFQGPIRLQATAKFLLSLPVLGDVVKDKFIENIGRETDNLKLRAIRVETQKNIVAEWKEQKQPYIVRHFNSQEVVCNVDKDCNFKYIKAVYYEVSNPVTNKNVMLTSNMYHNVTRHHMAYFHEPMLNLGNSPMGFYDAYLYCTMLINALKGANVPEEVMSELAEIEDKINYLEEQRFAAVIAKDIPDMSVFDPDEYEKENKIVPIYDMLRTLVKWGAEDIHIKAGCRPIGVLGGDVTSCPSYPEFLSPERTKYYAYKLMTEGQQAQFEETLEMDISFRVPTVARFRCNIYWSQGAVGMVLRVIPTDIRPVEVLGVPLILKKLVFEKLGLCLVTGQTGSGKTTTLAAIVEFCNVNRAIHILTLENPVEYVYQNKKAIFTQRAIEIDSLSFPMAMRAALREKPDIILIGEMRDPDTIMAGLKAAETGHLVMSTLHTNDAVQTINRIVNTFPPHEQETIREQVGHTIKACVAQRLIKRFDKPGRVCAIEIMLVTPNARGQNTRGYITRNEVNELYKVVQTSAYDGMQSMNMALFEHYRNGVITPDEALSNSDNPDELTRWMREDIGLGADVD